MKKNLAIKHAQAISLSEKLQRGDIIFVNKGLYKHYGIYAGNGTVVHYSDKSSNFGLDIKVQEASPADFADGFEVKVCRLDPKKYTLYSADETVKRAYSRLGEKTTTSFLTTASILPCGVKPVFPIRHKCIKP